MSSTRFFIVPQQKTPICQQYCFVVKVFSLHFPLDQEARARVRSCIDADLLNEVYMQEDSLPIEGVLPESCVMLWVENYRGVNNNTANTLYHVIHRLLSLTACRLEDIEVSTLYLFPNASSIEVCLSQIIDPVSQWCKVLKPGQLDDFLSERQKQAMMARGCTQTQALQSKASHESEFLKRIAIPVDLEVSDALLQEISNDGIQSFDGKRRGRLGLSLEDLHQIRRYYRAVERPPYDIELEALAQSWSEHCSHRTFNGPIDEIQEGLFRRYIRGATEKIRQQKGKKDICVSVFSDNSGAILWNEKYLLTHKVETHNSPSAIEPYGGAMTGILGVNRDCMGFGIGAKPIANTYGFCFAHPSSVAASYFRDEELSRPVLPPGKVIRDVIRGVEDGGNCSGIPTVLGNVYYDASYQAKPLVFVGTIGLVESVICQQPSHVANPQENDLIVVLGGRVGKDGIHGATLSSGASNEQNDMSMVQIGDPFLQKKVCDVLLVLRDQGLYHAVTDNGAGGLSSSVGELGREGFEVELEKVRLKIANMLPWEIWISESQERMTLSVAPRNLEKLHEICALYDVESLVIGKFTKSGVGVIRYRGHEVFRIETRFLLEGYPRIPLVTESIEPLVYENDALDAYACDFGKALLTMLQSPNLCSREGIIRQYDHEVQGASVQKPLQGEGGLCSDAVVLAPLLDSNRGVVLAHGLCPGYGVPFLEKSDIPCFDPYDMAASAIDTAIRHVVSAGGDPDQVALLDNFCWCDSSHPKRLWQLKRAAESCHDHALAYGAPFISGKDSLFNDFSGYREDQAPVSLSVIPTLLISAIASMQDVRCVVPSYFKEEADAIYVLGETKKELGGSEYARTFGITDTRVPKVLPEEALLRYRRVSEALRKGLLTSSLSIGLGGLGLALAKASIGGLRGCTIHVEKIKVSGALQSLKGSAFNLLFFSETQSRLLVTVSKACEDQFLRLFAGDDKVARIGVVEGASLSIKQEGEALFSLPVKKLRDCYQKGDLGDAI